MNLENVLYMQPRIAHMSHRLHNTTNHFFFHFLFDVEYC